MTVASRPIESLLPHAAPMLLLDRLADYDDETAHAQAEIRADHPLLHDGAVPAHAGIELMAQACGAHVGAQAQDQGKPVVVGFLLGTRSYHADVAGFAIGAIVDVHVRRVFNEDGMGVYDCRLELNGQTVAAAQLNLYQPPDLAAARDKLGVKS